MLLSEVQTTLRNADVAVAAHPSALSFLTPYSMGSAIPAVSITSGEALPLCSDQTGLVECSRVPLPVGSRPAHGPRTPLRASQGAVCKRTPWSCFRQAAGGGVGRRAP